MSFQSTWPAAETEELLWEPSASTSFPTRRMRPAGYLATVPPMVAGLSVPLEPEVAARAELAAQELARLDAELGDRFSNYAPILLRSEAASSSQIENLTASARSVFRAEAGLKTGVNAQQVVSNTRALQAAVRLADRIDVAAVLQMHSALMERQSIHEAGRLREEAVWIGRRSDSPVGAEFVAPHFSRVEPLLDDLVRFAAREDVSPLVAAAIAHAQFETIHPFTDGNGRTGRALAQAVLRGRGVLRNVAVPVSAGLLADVGGYHAALQEYRAGHLAPIVEAFADASLRAVRNTRQLVGELDALRDEWEERLTVRKDSKAWPLLEVVMRKPVLDAATAAGKVGVKAPNVYAALRALESAGVLSATDESRRGRFWRSDEVLDALDRFAKRAGRRELPS